MRVYCAILMYDKRRTLGVIKLQWFRRAARHYLAGNNGELREICMDGLCNGCISKKIAEEIDFIEKAGTYMYP